MAGNYKDWVKAEVTLLLNFVGEFATSSQQSKQIC